MLGGDPDPAPWAPPWRKNQFPFDEDEDGAETPRLGFASARERYRGREFLEALRSPDRPGVRQSGGWGLGAFNEDGKEKADEDDEDEQPDWDNLQVRVPHQAF